MVFSTSMVLLLGACVLCIAIAGALGYAFVCSQRKLHKLSERAMMYHSVEKALEEKSEALSRLSGEHAQVLEACTRFRTQVQFLEEQVTQLKQQSHTLTVQLDQARNKHHETLTSYELMSQKLVDMQGRIQDWEKTREEHLRYTQATVAKVGQELSSKLLEDHKREKEESNKHVAERIKQHEEKFLEQFQHIVGKVESLNKGVLESKETVDIVKRALLSPSGAGGLAEMTLENLLKNSGLIEGQDYVLQCTINQESQGGKCLRPDAIVFLQHNHLMVIDAKASKFFLEIERLHHQEDKDKLEVKLKETMQQHLRDLLKRDYQEAIRETYFDITKGKRVGRVIMAMFLPSEAALSTLYRVDQSFIEKAWKHEIYPTGPLSLINMLAHARFQQTQLQQAENYERILLDVRKLFTHVSTLYEHAERVGKSIKQSVQHYDKFAGSFNHHFLSTMKKLQKLGVESQKSKLNIDTLQRYQVVSSSTPPLIDIEVNPDELEQEQPKEDLYGLPLANT